MNSALPYILDIANRGIEQAMQNEPAIHAAVNTHNGKLMNLMRLSPKEE
jgi:alanine dehydrogenase